MTGSRELLALSLVGCVSKHFFVCFLAADPAVENTSTQHPGDAQNQMASLQVQSVVGVKPRVYLGSLVTDADSVCILNAN